METEKSWDIGKLPLRKVLSRHLHSVERDIDSMFGAEVRMANYKLGHAHERIINMDEPAISPEEEKALLVNNQIIKTLTDAIAVCKVFLSTLEKR